MLNDIVDFLSQSPADPVRLPLLSSHKTILMILGTYLLFVKVVGPKIMESRKPFDLRGPIKVYNIMQILYNVVMFVFVSDYLDYELYYKLHIT